MNVASQSAAHTARPAGWKGLPTWVLDEFGIRVDRLGRVTIPYRLADGRLHNVRLVPGDRRWWKFRGLPLVPFGLNLQTPARLRSYRCLAIVEGESDALALYGSTLGADGLDVLGVPGAGTWKSAWRGHADGYDAVYVIGDGDDAGRAFSWRARRDLVSAMVVNLPDGDDVRSILQRDGVGPLVDAIAEGEAIRQLEAALRLRREIPKAEFLASLRGTA